MGWPAWSGTPATPPYFRYVPQAFVLAQTGPNPPTGAKALVIGDTHANFIKTAHPVPVPSATFAHWQVQNAQRATYKLDIAAGTFTTGTPLATNWDRFYGSAVLRNTVAHKNRILRVGGSTGTRGQSHPLGDPQSLGPNSVEEWDDVGQSWVAKTGLNEPRVFQNAVVLPTGHILILGGSTKDDQNNPFPIVSTPVMNSEIYDPGPTPTSLGSRQTVPATAAPRVYHAVPVLLPDARVAILGGHDVAGLPVSRHTVEIYSPSYLFQGSRPTINSVTPSAIPYGANAAVVNVSLGWSGGEGEGGGTSDFELRAVLIRPASVTHHFDFDQRYIELASTVSWGPGSTQNVNITMPPNSSHAPQGYYMLFVLQRDLLNPGAGEIPSVAFFVQVV